MPCGNFRLALHIMHKIFNKAMCVLYCLATVETKVFLLLQPDEKSLSFCLFPVREEQLKTGFINKKIFKKQKKSHIFPPIFSHLLHKCKAVNFLLKNG